MKKNPLKRLNLFNLPGKIVVAVLFCVIFLACKQNSIFYHISIEPPQKDPLIGGSPTSIIHIKDKAVYVGIKNGGTIYSNDGAGWSQIERPGGHLIDLATDGKNLYALLYQGDVMGSTFIKKFTPGSGWDSSQVSFPGHSLQSIYGVSAGSTGEIFVGSQYRNGITENYAILYLDTTAFTLSSIKDNEVSLLCGAAYKNGVGAFLATMGRGVFVYDGVITGPVTGTDEASMFGIIETYGAIIATGTDKDGNRGLYNYDINESKFKFVGLSANFTGAMCVWKQKASSISVAPAINIDPPVITIPQGGDRTFTATVTGLGNPNVKWTLANESPGTKIDETTGYLELDPGQITDFLVVAVSEENPLIRVNATVSVAAAGELYGIVGITGVPEVGETLTALTTGLDSPNGNGSGSYTYQWTRGGKDIPAPQGTDPSGKYTLIDLDLGEIIGVTVTDASIAGSVASAGLKITLPPNEPWKPSLLLLGIRGSNNNQGYREIVLDPATGRILTENPRIPGDNTLSSVTSRTKYNASIGKHPVHAIMQGPPDVFSAADTEKDLPIFASTSIKGLWSYRNGEWNAED